jgi:arginase family enzyme
VDGLVAEASLIYSGPKFLLGARELDPGEMALLAESHVTIVPVGRVATGLAQLLAQAPLDDALDYVHLDLDVLDPQVARPTLVPTVRARCELRAKSLQAWRVLRG